MNIESTLAQEVVNLQGADPVLTRSFRGHKDKVTQILFNPNMR